LKVLARPRGTFVERSSPAPGVGGTRILPQRRPWGSNAGAERSDRGPITRAAGRVFRAVVDACLRGGPDSGIGRPDCPGVSAAGRPESAGARVVSGRTPCPWRRSGPGVRVPIRSGTAGRIRPCRNHAWVFLLLSPRASAIAIHAQSGAGSAHPCAVTAGRVVGMLRLILLPRPHARRGHPSHPIL